MANPEVQKALVDATIMDSMLNATTTTKSGDEVIDYKERRQSATTLAKLKGFDAGQGKRERILEEVNKMKRFFEAQTISVEKVEGDT